MGWDSEEAKRYTQISATLGKIAAGESDARLKDLLLSMSTGYADVANYFRAKERDAARKFATLRIAETEESEKANRFVRAIWMKLEKQWQELAVELDRSGRPPIPRE